MQSDQSQIPSRSLVGLNAANFFQAEMVGIILPLLNALLKQANWDAISKMPWWAPLGGLDGAVQVYAGLTLVHKVGAGPFVGLTVTAALIMSLLLDHYGWFHMPVHAVNPWPIAGAALMVAGIAFIAKH